MATRWLPSRELSGLLAACIVGFSPTLVYYVHVETLDVPMFFWFSAALYCYVRILQIFELRYYVGLAVLAAVSTATKDYAYGAFVLLPFPLGAALARHDFSGALAWGERARKIDPYSGNVYGVIGDAEVELGHYADAFATFQKMVNTLPDTASYARVSYARELQGDVPGADKTVGVT